MIPDYIQGRPSSPYSEYFLLNVGLHISTAALFPTFLTVQDTPDSVKIEPCPAPFCLLRSIILVAFMVYRHYSDTGLDFWRRFVGILADDRDGNSSASV